MQVLFDVNLEIDEGEIVALLGTNGAGKSTLLKAISGLVEAERGAIVFDGRDMTHTPPQRDRRRAASLQVPGGAGVFPSLTVAENLQAGRLARTAGQGARRPRRSSACSTCSRSSASASTSRPANLSGGQQQMLALAHGVHRSSRGC